MKKNIIPIILVIVVLIGGFLYLSRETNAPEDNELPKTENEDSNNDIKDDSNEKDEDVVEDENDDVSDEGDILEIGKKAPNFTLETLEGETVSLEDYRGKIVLINFWATWCPYCRDEMPDLQKLYDNNKDDDFIVLAIDVAEEKSLAEKYIKEGGYTFPVLLDKDGAVAYKKYLVGGLPASFFIDKDGTLLGGVPGMMIYPQMTSILDQIKAMEE